MYNRYTPNDQGVYERIPMEEQHSRDHRRHEPEHQPHRAADPSSDAAPPPRNDGSKSGLLSGLFRKLRLDDIDTGDLLLLVILFLLFKDGEDEELLIALGLLLIL